MNSNSLGRATKRHKTISNAIYDHNLTDSCQAVDYWYEGLVKGRGDPLLADERVQLINGIAQGSGPNQRIGSVIDLKEVSWDCFVYPTPGALNVFSDVFKLAIVYDRQPTGSIPSYSSIFQALSNSGSTNDKPPAPQNVDNIDRFYVLRDMKWSLAPAYDQLEGLGPFPTSINTLGTAKRGNMMSDKVILSNMRTVYGGTGHTMSAINTGALYVVTNGYFEDLPLLPECAWSYNINVRVFYKDYT